MKIVIIKYFLIVLTILPFSHVLSQSCGFGCLGLSGVYSGYSIQKYEADGLNNYFNYIINSSNSLLPLKGKYDFKEGRGFRVGINLMRAQYEKFFFTVKGYYQFLSEEKNLKIPDGFNYYNIYEAKFEMNNWGIGLDIGIPLFGFVNWKILDAELKFFSPKLALKNYNNNPSKNSIANENLFTPNKVKMGYSVGSGLIFNLIEDYISIELTGMYTFIEIDNLTDDQNGLSIPNNGSNEKLISTGGFQGIVQINVGIPL